jgi:hypothetical protein
MNLLLLLSLGLMVAGFAVSAKGFLNLEIQYNVDRCEFDQVSDVRPGLASVSGTVQPADEVLQTPISGQDCVLFAVSVEEKHQQGDGPLWQESSSARHETPFYLSDDSGRILVDPDDLLVHLEEKNVIDVPNGVVPPDPIRSTGEELREEKPDWVEDLDLNLLTCQTSRDTRFVEYYIERGEAFHVFGTVMDRSEGRNLCYDDEDTYVVYRTDSTPAFELSKESRANDILSNVRIAPWMVSGGVLFMVGMIGMAGALA